MNSRWSDQEAERFVARYARRWGRDLALRTYASRLLGGEPSLVLHGGGNTSVKTEITNLLQDRVSALMVKASGHDLARIEPGGHTGLDLSHLVRLRNLEQLDDRQMVDEFMTHRLDPRSRVPSIETLVHAFLPPKFIDHCHADAILALTNQPGGEALVRDALGDGVLVLDYFEPGFSLAKASAGAFHRHPDRTGMVWMRHGLITWGETARESYEATIDLVSRAEAFLARKASRSLTLRVRTSPEAAQARWSRVAPILRGLLARPTGNPDQPWQRDVLLPLQSRETLDLLDSHEGRSLAVTPPLTADHLIRIRNLPLWIEPPESDDSHAWKKQVRKSLSDYSRDYRAFVRRHRIPDPESGSSGDFSPRLILIPGIGAACAGRDAEAAGIARDIARQTFAVKARIARMGGTYQGLEESHLYLMEHRGIQQAKLAGAEQPLRSHVAVVTGAAGAIGSGISRGLLEEGCHVAVTDLPGDRLEGLAAELNGRFPNRVTAVPLDVTSPRSVAEAFDSIVLKWGGIDLVVINAGVALAGSLAEMDSGEFRKSERVNVEGTLHLLSRAARHFRLQGTGGDVVLVSTKNVFAPGAGFGAYSATKAASHQLARIASLELAEMGVRVNMVAPDAVFSDGARRSGLWEQVGPDRMRARGLDREGLEEYYRKRNLLQARITAEHVARAVLFFASRQTPTTGATLPVDGGLPDATPR